MAQISFKIRPLKRDEIPALLDLYQHLNPDDQRPSDQDAEQIFDLFLKYNDSAVLVGEVDHQLVTSCCLVVVPNLTRGGQPYALLENVVTHRCFRNRGHGRAVLRAATAAAWAANCYKVMLLTGRQDEATQNFYEGAGFEPTKRGFQQRRPLMKT